MASSTLPCAPLLQVGRGREGGCSFGGANVAVNVRRTGSGGALAKALGGNSLRRPCGEGLRCSGRGCGISPRALPVEAAKKLPANVEMLETYEIEEKVRDYELDHYGVVNNAIYAQFCQHARTELLENIGFSPDAVTETGRAMAISDMSMKFLSPLRSGDRYIVSSRVAGTTAVRLIFEDHIYRLPGRELIMSARSTVVVLDKNSKPGRLPEEIKDKLVNRYITNYRVNGSSACGYVINGKGNSTNGNANGKSASGNVTGNSKPSEVDGNSTNVLLEDNSTNDNLVKDYVNHRSATRVPSLVA